MHFLCLWSPMVVLPKPNKHQKNIQRIAIQFIESQDDIVRFVGDNLFQAYLYQGVSKCQIMIENIRRYFATYNVCAVVAMVIDIATNMSEDTEINYDICHCCTW